MRIAEFSCPAVEIVACDFGMAGLIRANGIIGDPCFITALVGIKYRCAHTAMQVKARNHQRVNSACTKCSVKRRATERAEELFGMQRFRVPRPQGSGDSAPAVSSMHNHVLLRFQCGIRSEPSRRIRVWT